MERKMEERKVDNCKQSAAAETLQTKPEKAIKIVCQSKNCKSAVNITRKRKRGRKRERWREAEKSVDYAQIEGN